MENKNPFLFFIHITKTGGSSFKQILSRNLRKKLSSIYYGVWEQPFTKDQLGEFLKHQENHLAATSHRFCLDLPYNDLTRNVRAIAFVRDPESRFLSHYFFHRNNNMPGYDEVKTMDVESYVQFALRDGNESWLIDGQYKFLMENAPNDDGLKIIKDLISSGKLILLPLMRFDEGCIILEKELPEIIKNASYVRQNISIRDHKPNKDTVAEIRSLMDKDTQLVEMANECLNGYLKKHFENDENIEKALKGFRSRCQWLKIIYWIPRKTAGKILRALKILD